jgi:hypothetical protein
MAATSAHGANAACAIDGSALPRRNKTWKETGITRSIDGDEHDAAALTRSYGERSEALAPPLVASARLNPSRTVPTAIHFAWRVPLRTKSISREWRTIQDDSNWPLIFDVPNLGIGPIALARLMRFNCARGRRSCDT